MSGWDYLKKLEKEDKEAFKRSQAPARIPSQPEAREMVQKLCQLEEGLNDWELPFIENVSKWEGNYTSAQLSSIAKIAERLKV
jgi:hypothetical protein